MNIRQLRTALDTHQISVSELNSLYLDRIRRLNPVLNCYISVCENTEKIKAAQKLIDSGKAFALTGIPLSVKDNICTKSAKTTCASKMLDNFIPDYNAHVIDCIDAQAFIMNGKTNMDEFAMGSSSQSSYYGGVKNPYDLMRSPGGSSGGGAASVSAGLCAGAIATDTGGSVRQPAALCGVTGLTPTYGAVSRRGLIAFASSLDRIGVIANSARDAAYILNEISVHDAMDYTSHTPADKDYSILCNSNIRSLKIGIAKEFFDCCDSEIREAVFKAVEYYRAMGCEIIECTLPSLEYAVSAYYLISSAEASSNLSRFDGIRYGYRASNCSTYSELIKKSRADGFGDEVKRRIMLGAYALSSGYYDEYYRRACLIREQLRHEYALIFEKCDVMITPTSPKITPRIDELKNNTAHYNDDICTVPVNIAGLCAINTTCGYDSNSMPIGMSIVGKPFDEKTIIALCDRYEQDFKRMEAVL